jgi:hypothetical protein
MRASAALCLLLAAAVAEAEADGLQDRDLYCAPPTIVQHHPPTRDRGLEALDRAAQDRQTLAALGRIRMRLSRYDSSELGTSALLVYGERRGRYCYWLYETDSPRFEDPDQWGEPDLYGVAGLPEDWADREAPVLAMNRALREALDPEAAMLLRAPLPRVERARGISRVSRREALSEVYLSLLSDLLVPADLAAELENVRQLMIVPVGAIASTPFALLAPFDDGRPLIERMSVTLVPSLADFLAGLRPGDWHSNPGFQRPLIVAHPDVSAEQDWMLPPLPGTELQATSVSRSVGDAAVLTGAEAELATVVTEAARADFLFLGAHCVPDEARPREDSFLAFAGGRWTAAEIRATRLRADVAILGACQTTSIGAHDAGVLGLGRALQQAGVSRVVTSLWSVDDSAMQVLMARFSRHMLAMPPAEALRRAMLETRERYPDPVHWASMTVFGAADRIPENHVRN